jgi:hypothetical protein
MPEIHGSSVPIGTAASWPQDNPYERGPATIDENALLVNSL